jgi:hypothetical protein
VWWIENRLSVEREMACDDAVLAETANPRGYATCLVSLLEKSLAHRRWSMAQAAVHRAHEASLRLAQILDTNRPVATRIWKPALGMVGVFSMLCLIAVPPTPQFVAFNRTPLTNSAHANTATLRQSSVDSSAQASSVGAAVIPASFRMSESSSSGSSRPSSPKVVSTRVLAHKPAQHQLVGTLILAARSNGPQLPAVMMRTSASREIVPQFRTVVFIETTQFVTDDSSVWSVQVWRVTLLSTRLNHSAKVPVANSI